ncbi:MAG: AAA family ATPase [Gammaproteobacteria bacterium]|nr:AAA family ATPase [Gammaproteobacteria bacterium]
MAKFIGRKAELQRLLDLNSKKSASFVVVKGRRRIGKSRLIEEFSRYFTHYYTFTGLPPDRNTTTKHQLDEFSRQIAREFNTANARYDDWSDAFWAIGERVQSGKILILFDEISWMGSKDPTFLGKIKNLWDSQLKKNDQLIFVICGSASSWIEKNILSSTGFVGRISFTLTLAELSLVECNQFWPENISSYEKFKILSITGGVPKYLEEVLPHSSAEKNTTRLCFTKGGFLTDEFEQIFSDIFLRKTDYYKKIIQALVNGAKEQYEICDALKISRHGRIPEYLNELESAGFISKDHAWNLKTGQDTEIRKYRLSDNYLRFYLKYIHKNFSKIQREMFACKSIASLPQWHSMMGFQFENLVLNSRVYLRHVLGISSEDVVCENPYFQRKTTRNPGCQIDYMMQTKFNTLYICEIKFSKNLIGINVVNEVRQKIERLKRPKGFSCRPVLVHVNGVTEEVMVSDYFAKIIDFSRLLESQ